MARISRNQLLKLRKKYPTDESIARLFGISRQAVHQMRRTHGIAPLSHAQTERDGQIARLYAQGASGVKLAREFSLSLSQIYRITARHQVRKTNGRNRRRP